MVGLVRETRDLEESSAPRSPCRVPVRRSLRQALAAGGDPAAVRSTAIRFELPSRSGSSTATRPKPRQPSFAGSRARDTGHRRAAGRRRPIPHVLPDDVLERGAELPVAAVVEAIARSASDTHRRSRRDCQSCARRSPGGWSRRRADERRDRLLAVRRTGASPPADARAESNGAAARDESGDVLPRDPKAAGGRCRAGVRRVSRDGSRRAHPRATLARARPRRQGCGRLRRHRVLGAAPASPLTFPPHRGPSGPGPRIASTPRRHVRCEGSARARYGARRRTAPDRGGRCVVRVPGGDASPIRDTLRRGRAVGLGPAQSAPSSGPGTTCPAAPSELPEQADGRARRRPPWAVLHAPCTH